MSSASMRKGASAAYLQSFPLTPSPDALESTPNPHAADKALSEPVASAESAASAISSTITAPAASAPPSTTIPEIPNHGMPSKKDSAAARKKVLSVSLAISDRPSVSSIIERLETRTQQEIEEQNRLDQLHLERLAAEASASTSTSATPKPYIPGHTTGSEPLIQKDIYQGHSQSQVHGEKEKNHSTTTESIPASSSSSHLLISPEPDMPTTALIEMQNTRGGGSSGGAAPIPPGAGAGPANATAIATTTTTTTGTTTGTAAARVPSSASPSYSGQPLLQDHFSSISLGSLDLGLNFEASSEYSATNFNTLNLQAQQSSELPLPRPKPDAPGSQTHKQPQQPPPSSSSSASVIQQLQNQIQDLAQAGKPFDPPPPLVRTTSHNGALPIRHPVPDVPPRSITTRENIAQLEATAVRLSMTSSIDDAIHNLHSELKRSDSRRSSILAASLKEREREEEARSLPALSRHISNASSIVSVNHVARLGGYSPGEYSVTSSTAESITTRLRAKSDTDPSTSLANLSRSGPGKSSIRSIHSRPLAGIVETERDTPARNRSNSRMEPLSEQEQQQPRPSFQTKGQTASPSHSRKASSINHLMRMPSFEASTAETLSLGFDAQGAASNRRRLSSIAQNNSETETEPQTQGQHSQTQAQSQDTHNNTENPQVQPTPHQKNHHSQKDSTASTPESERAKDVFDDFDGVHCDPDVDLHNDRHEIIHSLSDFNPLNLSDTLGFNVAPSGNTLQDQQYLDQNQPYADNGGVPHPGQDLTADYAQSGEPVPSTLPQNAMRQSMAMPPVRPQSYMDPETGMEMAYYPARVPMMLNLPQKLSKKPKAAQRNARQSKVLSMMPNINRQSAPWLNNPSHLEGEQPHPEQFSAKPIDFLGDPLAGTHGTYSMASLDGNGNIDGPGQSQQETGTPYNNPVSPNPTFQTGSDSTEHANNGLRGVGRDSLAIRDTIYNSGPLPMPAPAGRQNNRASHLPPQLRASVFFEMPSTTTDIKIEAGSATHTLDKLLDASATAPVSAFTDHLIAGKLGVDGQGRPNRRSMAPLSDKRQSHNLYNSVSVDGLRKPAKLKKRASQMSIGISSVNGPDGSAPSGATQAVRSSRRLDLDVSDNDSHHDTDLHDGANAMRPDDDELDQTHMTNVSLGGDEQDGDDEEEQEEEEGEDMYYGPPTTLLAELQIRKQQQKLRTRGHFPNGMHSTLLELDAVAERQRQNRVKGKVNLAWEEGADGAGNEESDEDVPLGLLYATKATGTKNLNLAVAEMNRPLGLMERRDMEDNEPLSSRRARIMGDQYTPVRNHTMVSRAAPTGLGNYAAPESESEDEPLAARRARLKNEESSGALPSTRPVSRAFSNELLTQFAAPEEETKSKTPAIEAEETLGQRRRRLQAEREAAAATAKPAASLVPGSQKAGGLANLLAAHPTANANPLYSGAFSTSKGNLGFKNGVYNTGRVGIRPSTSQVHLQNPNGTGLQARQHNLATSASMGQLTPAYHQQAPLMGGGGGYPQGAYAQPMYGHGQQTYGGYGMPVNKQVDRVEQWRQSVMQ
ncbi:hypothetical protein HOO65_011367 [Ceratocystis lukuohia]|uniref:Uncharacterized protein n=1 Tax=Ceratocystis lukuohia TaxID=2019550 RepID=A0ABR4MUX9_9PEZI